MHGLLALLLFAVVGGAAGACLPKVREITATANTGVGGQAVPAGTGPMAAWHFTSTERATLEKLPGFLQGGTGFFPSQVEDIEAGTEYEVECPCPSGCDVYVFVHHCLPCHVGKNGGYPGVLPADGWEAGSCAPRFTLRSGSSYPMTGFRKFVPGGQTMRVGATTTDLRNVAIFVVEAMHGCEGHMDAGSCGQASACAWRDGECRYVWCPRKTVPGPRGSPPACACPEERCKAGTEVWGRWINRDAPSLTSDWERTPWDLGVKDVCPTPNHVIVAGQCRRATDKVDWTQTGDVISYPCGPFGLGCMNNDQPAGKSCSDYEVRFRCCLPH